MCIGGVALTTVHDRMTGTRSRGRQSSQEAMAKPRWEMRACVTDGEGEPGSPTLMRFRAPLQPPSLAPEIPGRDDREV